MSNATCVECGKLLSRGSAAAICPECERADKQTVFVKDDATSIEPTIVPRVSAEKPGHDNARMAETVAPTGDVRCEDATGQEAVHFGGSVTEEATESGSSQARRFGDYEIIDEIARGGMGVVFKAQQVSLNRPVALKMILAAQLASDGDVQRFYMEAESAARLEHPGIVPIYEFGAHEGQHFFSMGLVQGGSLNDLVHDGPVPLRTAAEMMQAVAEAVQYAHARNIVHRDLKPANVLLDEHGQPKVTDFGLAKNVERDSGLTATGQVMGTPAYMPPEQAAGKIDEVGPLADVYSLGAILFYLLTGRPPFEGESIVDTLHQVIGVEPRSPRSLNKDVDRDLETITLKCLEKSPDRRYGSAQALSEDLNRWLSAEPIAARRTTALERVFKWGKRKPLAAAFSGLAVVFALTLAIGGPLVAIHQSELRLRADVERGKAQAARDSESDARKNEAKERKKAQALARKNIELAEDERQAAYFSDMNLAQHAHDSGSIHLMNELLEKHCPQPDQKDLRGLEWYHWWWAGRLQREQILMSAPCRRLAVSPDGNTVAAASYVRRLMICDAADGRIVHQTLDQSSTGEFDPLSFSPDGRTLAVGGGFDGSIRIFRTADWTTVGRFQNALGDEHPVRALAFSPSRTELLAVTGNESGLITFWNAASAKWTREGTLQTNGAVRCLAFSADGGCLVAGTKAMKPSESAVIVCDMKERRIVQRISEHKHWVHAVAFSPVGPLMASGSEDASVRLWRLQDDKLHPVASIPVFASVESLAFSPDGKRLVAGTGVSSNPLVGSSGNNKVLVWNVEEEQSPMRIATVKGHSSEVNAVTFVGDAQTVWSTGGDKVIKTWDLSLCEPHDTLSRDSTRNNMERSSFRQLGWTADGNTLLFVDDDSTVRRWDRAARAVQAREKGGGPRDYDGVACEHFALSDDGAALAGVTSDGNLRVWNAESGRLLWGPSPLHLPPISRIAVSRSGRTVAATSRAKDFKEIPALSDMSVIVIDMASGRTTSIDGQKVHFLTSPIFSPDGKSLLLCSWQSIEVWDVAANSREPRFRVDTGVSGCAAYSPDGTTIAVGNWDQNEIRLYDARTGKPKGNRLRGHVGVIVSVAFSSGGRRLVSGGEDGTVRIWDPVAGRLTSTLRGHSSMVNAVSVSPTGHGIVSCSADLEYAGYPFPSDGSIKIWHAATPEEVDRYPVDLVPLVPGSETRSVDWRYLWTEDSKDLQEPGPGWHTVDYDDSAWKSARSPIGTYHPATWTARNEHHIWLRHEFELSDVDNADLFFYVQVHFAAEMYLNGVPAARAYAYVDNPGYLQCSKAAARALRPGKNVLAVHATSLYWDSRIDVGLYRAGKDGFLGVLTRAIEARQHSLILLNQRGRLYGEHRKWKQAAADFERVLVLRPQYVEYLESLLARRLVGGSQIEPETWRYTVRSPKRNWNTAQFDDGHWKTGAAPFGSVDGDKIWLDKTIKTVWNESNSSIWLRREFELPEDVRGTFFFRACTDDEADIFLNGVSAAKGRWTGSAYHRLDCKEEAARSLRPGRNVLAVHCKNVVRERRFDVELYWVPRAAEDAQFDALSNALHAHPTDRDLLIGRGGAYVRRRKWKEAAADFDKVAELSATRDGAFRYSAGAGAAAFYNSAELSATDEAGWLRALSLWAASGDVDAYRRRCEEVLTHFADLADGDRAQWILRGCLAMPPSEKAQVLIQPLAERAYQNFQKYPLYVPHAKSLADLRSARYAEALGHAKKVLDDLEPLILTWPEKNKQLWRGLSAQCCFVQAICYHELGQPGEAQRALENGIAFRNAGTAQYPNFGWWETLIADVLRHETERQLETNAGD